MALRSGVKSYRISFDFYVTPGVKILLIANFAIYIFEAFLFHFSGRPGYDQLLKWFGLVPAILLNMLMLWMFGRELELVWGRSRFLRYYFLTGVGAGLLNVFVKTVPYFFGYGLSYVSTFGASGAIFGIMIACAILFPDRRVYMFPIPVAMSMRMVIAIMAAFTFLGTFGLGDDKVSHICHLGGMLVGYVYLRRGSFLYSVRNSVSDWQNQRNRKRFQVYINKHKNEPPSRPDRWVN